MSEGQVREERLYSLLPALYRIRDAAQGEPLRALFAILERELGAVHDDTQGLYDDWFIETCREWVTPYLGDLLGVELVRSIEAEGFSARAYVANALGYRRRKGTAAVLEQLARDVTGWPARAVEYFERLTTSQHMSHVRLHAPVTLSLRNANRLELVNGPFGAECHTGEVRSITSRRGRFNISNVGLHLFRLRAYPLEGVDARAVEAVGVPRGRYQFDALGTAGPLFNSPRAETEIVHLAEERDVPARLRRRALHAEQQDGEAPDDGWFGEQPVLRVVRIDGGMRTEILPPELRICNLEVEPDAPSTDWPRPDTAGRVLCDPQTGRLAFPTPAVQPPPDRVVVDYAYGFSADLGGGPYDRRQTIPERLPSPALVPNQFQQGVSQDHASLAGELIHTSFAQAIDAWNLDALAAWTRRESLDRVIVVMDSRTYVEELTRSTGRCIVIPPQSRLRVLAARWPAELDDPDLGGEKRTEGRLDPTGVRPHLRGNLEVLGLADPLDVFTGGALELDGFLIEGALTILPGALGSLALRHSTLVPGFGGLSVASTEPLSALLAPAPFEATQLRALATNAGLDLELTRCIADGLTLTGSVGSLKLRDCILGAGGERLEPHSHAIRRLSAGPLGAVLAARAAPTPVLAAAVAAVLDLVPDVNITWTGVAAGFSLVGNEVDATVEASTLLGKVLSRVLEGSESLFMEQVHVRVIQAGCLRFSYTEPSSRTPQRFRCQPDLALAAAESAARNAGQTWSARDASAVAERLRPLFTSVSYGHPGYCQLARAAASELTTGAEDGSEMGAFTLLKQAHRESNLRAALEQYLRFGLDAGLIFAT